MSNSIVKSSEVNLDDLGRVAKLLALSGYFDAKGDSDTAIAQIATKILAGQEIGIGPFASVNGIHVIQGRPTLAANLLAAKVKGHPRYDYRVRKMEDNEVSIEFFEDGKSIGVSTFTIADARRAQTKNMDKFPKNMLFARAISNGVRWYCPDIFSGNAVYTPEDFGVDGETGELIGSSYNVVDEQPASAPQPAPESTAVPTRVSEWLASTDPAGAAKTWAVESGACGNEFEAKNSLSKIVSASGGRLTKATAPAILEAFFQRQMEKLNAVTNETTVQEPAPETAPQQEVAF